LDGGFVGEAAVFVSDAIGAWVDATASESSSSSSQCSSETVPPALSSTFARDAIKSFDSTNERKAEVAADSSFRFDGPSLPFDAGCTPPPRPVD
jgi:hypothetical protein